MQFHIPLHPELGRWETGGSLEFFCECPSLISELGVTDRLSAPPKEKQGDSSWSTTLEVFLWPPKNHPPMCACAHTWTQAWKYKKRFIEETNQPNNQSGPGLLSQKSTCPACTQPWVQYPSLHNSMAHEMVDTRGWEVQLHGKYETSLGYLRPGVKNRKRKNSCSPTLPPKNFCFLFVAQSFLSLPSQQKVVVEDDTTKALSAPTLYFFR